MPPSRRKDTPEKSDEQPSRSPSYGLLNRPNGTNFGRAEGHQRPGLFGSMRHGIRMASEWRIPSMPWVKKTSDSLAASVTSPTSDPTSRLKRLSSSLRGRTPGTPVPPSVEAKRKIPSTVRGPLSRPHVELSREDRRSISGPSALPAKKQPSTTLTQLEEPSSSSPPRLETNTGMDFGQSLMGGNWSSESMPFRQSSCSKFVVSYSHLLSRTNNQQYQSWPPYVRIPGRPRDCRPLQS